MIYFIHTIFFRLLKVTPAITAEAAAAPARAKTPATVLSPVPILSASVSSAGVSVNETSCSEELSGAELPFSGSADCCEFSCTSDADISSVSHSSPQSSSAANAKTEYEQSIAAAKSTAANLTAKECGFLLVDSSVYPDTDNVQSMSLSWRSTAYRRS